MYAAISSLVISPLLSLSIAMQERDCITISYSPMIRTSMSVYQGVGNISFSENFTG